MSTFFNSSPTERVSAGCQSPVNSSSLGNSLSNSLRRLQDQRLWHLAAIWRHWFLFILFILLITFDLEQVIFFLIKAHDFFLMKTILKVLLNLLQYCFCFIFCVFGPKAHWITREVPKAHDFKIILLLSYIYWNLQCEAIQRKILSNSGECMVMAKFQKLDAKIWNFGSQAKTRERPRQRCSIHFLPRACCRDSHKP